MLSWLEEPNHGNDFCQSVKTIKENESYEISWDWTWMEWTNSKENANKSLSDFLNSILNLPLQTPSVQIYLRNSIKICTKKSDLFIRATEIIIPELSTNTLVPSLTLIRAYLFLEFLRFEVITFKSRDQVKRLITI